MSDISRAADKAQETLETLVSLGWKVVLVYVLFLVFVKVVLPGLQITVSSRRNNNLEETSSNEAQDSSLVANNVGCNNTATALTELKVVLRKPKYPNSEIQNYSSVVRGGFNTVIC
ncbi:TPA: hypothetical protein ACGIK9_002897 [Acinetobacter baumannii]|uniref:hypothetical protein n=1 Tax=Acinetobacter baumannii TaxID=470 RepID=UPI00338F7FBD